MRVRLWWDGGYTCDCADGEDFAFLHGYKDFASLDHLPRTDEEVSCDCARFTVKEVMHRFNASESYIQVQLSLDAVLLKVTDHGPEDLATLLRDLGWIIFKRDSVYGSERYGDDPCFAFVDD